MMSGRRSTVGTSEERRERLRRGRAGEAVAAGLLTLKGYWILARRHRTPQGEVDIIAVRGRRIAFVEVKRRATRDEAEASISDAQGYRIQQAAEHWLARNPRYQPFEMGFDAVFVMPWRFPRHLPNALAPE